MKIKRDSEENIIEENSKQKELCNKLYGLNSYDEILRKIKNINNSNNFRHNTRKQI
jgi:hypothetical protein